MTITIPIFTKRLAVLLLLIAGFAVFATGVEAQSRGRTQGRKEQAEKTESRSKASPQQQASRSTTQQKGESAQGSQGNASRGRSSSQRGAVRGGSNGQARAGNSQNSRGVQNNRNSQSSRRTQSRPNTQGRRDTQSSPANRAAESRSRSSSGASSESGAGSSRSSGGDARRMENGGGSGQRSTGGAASASRGRSTTSTRSEASSRQAAGSRGGNAQGRPQNNRGASARSRDNDRAKQSDDRRARIQPAPGYARGRTSNQYSTRNYVYTPPGHRGKYWMPPVYYHRPHVQINVVWPWQNRYRRKWAPHYKYRQVVYVEVGWGGRRRQARVDVRTNYHQQVRYADHRKAVVDIYLDEIEVYEDGYYVGRVRRIPEHLSHIEATVYRDGDVVFDRDVFLVGDTRSGFEMISTRHYGGYVMDYYDRSHGMRVGRLNFRHKRVESRRYSRLFDPYDFRGYAPISLLPEDRNLVADFGYESLSYGYYDDQYDPYYGGQYDDEYYDFDEYGNNYRYEHPAYDVEPYTGSVNRLSVEAIAETRKPLTGHSSNQFTTKQGIAIKYERESELQRIK